MTMLDRMRRHKNWLKWSLGLVCLAFVIFYIPDFLRGSTGTGIVSSDRVASVDSRAISGAEFRRRYQAQLNAYRTAYGGKLTVDDLQNYAPVWADPIATTFREYQIVAPGGPSFGGISMAEAFNLLELADLLPHVQAGAAVVVSGPSCSLLLKHEYPKLLASEGARAVAGATRDLMEYMVELARAGRPRR